MDTFWSVLHSNAVDSAYEADVSSLLAAVQDTGDIDFKEVAKSQFAIIHSNGMDYRGALMSGNKYEEQGVGISRPIVQNLCGDQIQKHPEEWVLRSCVKKETWNCFHGSVLEIQVQHSSGIIEMQQLTSYNRISTKRISISVYSKRLFFDSHSMTLVFVKFIY